MMQLSIQKFSSNVVEKLFCSAPQEFRQRFISELIESEKMSVLVNSNYGHYVVKRALELAEPHQVTLLMEAIRSNLGQLPNRRLRAKWEKVMGAGTDRLGPGVVPSSLGSRAAAPRQSAATTRQAQGKGWGDRAPNASLQRQSGRPHAEQ